MSTAIKDEEKQPDTSMQYVITQEISFEESRSTEGKDKINTSTQLTGTSMTTLKTTETRIMYIY